LGKRRYIDQGDMPASCEALNRMTTNKTSAGITRYLPWRIIRVFILALLALGLIRIVSTMFGGMHDRTLGVFAIALAASAFLSEGVRFINRRIEKKITWQRNPVRRFFIQLFLNIAFILFFSVVVKLFILVYLLHMDIHPFFREELAINGIIIFITLIIVLGDLCLFLIRRWRYSLIELEVSKRESLQFQFEMLRHQINPHFLFNSLNALNSLIYSDQDKAADFTRQLAQVFRNVLEMQDKEMVTLGEEIKLAEAYIRMIRIRFGQNLEITISPDTCEFDKYIPCMTTQLLIENALNHNIISGAMPLKIDIYTADGFLIIKNNLQLKTGSPNSTGMGLKNIANRYRMIGTGSIEVIRDTDSFMVRLPLIQEI
jgi:two-component system LytT family sensor kinase